MIVGFIVMVHIKSKREKKKDGVHKSKTGTYNT